MENKTVEMVVKDLLRADNRKKKTCVECRLSLSLFGLRSLEDLPLIESTRQSLPRLSLFYSI